jgi:hypothetical protein
MTHHRLGQAKEAQEALQRLRERMKDPGWAQNAEAQGFLREAEALLAKPKTPSGNLIQRSDFTCTPELPWAIPHA